MKYNLNIGIDVGLTNTHLVVLDPKKGALVYKEKRNSLRGFESNFDNIVDMIESVETKLGEKGTLGFSVSGFIHKPTGNIHNRWMPWLDHTKFFEEIGQAFSRAVRYQNVSRCVALSETKDGAGENHDIVFVAGLGSSASAGIVVHGKLLEGCNNMAGEWGQNALPWPQDDEWMGFMRLGGKRDHLEDFISGPGFERLYKIIAGRTLAPPEIMEEVRAGNMDAQIVFSKYIDGMARCFASIIHIIDPDVIILSRGISNIQEIYEEVPKVWGKYLLNVDIKTKIKPTKFGNISAARGAALLWSRE